MSDKFIEAIMGQVEAQVNSMCASAGQMTLGELAARMEAADKDALVTFEDGNAPDDLDSYRGYYRFIAVSKRGSNKTASDFATQLNEAIGKTFTGYKGGEFTMTRMTPVWVSEYGSASGEGIVGVEVTDKGVLLKTAQIES